MATRNQHRARAMIVIIGLGWLLSASVPTGGLVRWSFDLGQLFVRDRPPEDIVLVYLDEHAMQQYQRASPGEWDRTVHARLLDRLTRDQPRVVVFDIEFTQPGLAEADRRLGEALQRNGRTVLAGGRVDAQVGVGLGYTIEPPIDLFKNSAAAWGVAKVYREPDAVGRRFDPGDHETPGLAWAAAVVARAPVAQQSEQRLVVNRWLNYYGASRPFIRYSLSYTNAENRDPGYFRDKAVFIGGKPETLKISEMTDVYRTPFTRWEEGSAPGVDLAALAYANLARGDWLERLNPLVEWALLLVTGVGVGWLLPGLRWRRAVWTALGLAGLTAAAAGLGVAAGHTWFGWLVIVAVQIPGALVFCLLPRGAESGLAGASTAAAVSAESAPTRRAATGAALVVPDHTLIRCIGEGAYGQVWIARNAVGIYHAVKVIYASRFGVAEPYERAFRGIQKFMPIARSHDGFVHILHVGRNDESGHFYYIMEAADDQQAGRRIDPAAYAAKTLATELKARQSIPPRECLRWMLQLTEAVECLHQHQLIHRDIKPGNIIFVDQHPKLADIDLVTDLSGRDQVSRIGTEGYLAPEGPGTAAADVFSLGRMLYVALTGKSPELWPELPTRIAELPDCALFMELSQVVGRACEVNVARRYPAAARMHADLQAIAARLRG